MTKYRLDRDPDTGKPCMVADPCGIYYSAGEVDREIAKYQQQRFYFDKDGVLRPVEGHTTSEIRLAANMLSMQEKIEKRDDLIRRLRDFLKDGVRLGFYYCMDGMGDDFEKMMEEADATGTHDGGTVPEGDRSSTGPASARESEDYSE